MQLSPGSIRQLFLAATAVPIMFLTFGCGSSSGLKTVPVSGQITVDGQPLKGENATVIFKPVKGNPTQYEPCGFVDGDGKYSLQTADKKGAPPGQYVVVVAAYEAPAEEKRGMFKPARYRLLVNPKYGDAKTSGLVVEVVENPQPGAYDLKLTK